MRALAPSMNLLLVDDELSLRRTLRTALESMGHCIFEAGNSSNALEIVRKQRLDLAFLDLRLGSEDGLMLLPELLQASGGRIHVVIVTAFAGIDSAVAAMRKGAFDYLPKPFTPDQLRIVLNRSSLVRGLQNQVTSLEDRVGTEVFSGELETRDPEMQKIVDIAFQIATSDATVLLRGESGTGKGVLARAIHARSARVRQPFVTVHCPSLSTELLESDLFGHVRGSFTGAVHDKVGKVEAATGGTLFFDEIGDLPPALQPKLLRLVQDREYERVGEASVRTADVRIIAATNRDLEAGVRSGQFREDLLYRLNVIELTLPPLRRRPVDILPMARGLLKMLTTQLGKPSMTFSTEAEESIQSYTWPGNIRELRNAIERGVLLGRPPLLGTTHLPKMPVATLSSTIELGGDVSLEELEAEHIRRVVASAPTFDDAAKILGIDPSTLYRKRKRSSPPKGSP